MSHQKLGQHFLSQTSWRTRIAETLPADRDAIWLEIGAGHGEMTELLATRARRVIAIETDAALSSALSERAAHLPARAKLPVETGSPAKAAEPAATPGWPNVEVIHADILSLDLAALVLGQAGNEPLRAKSSQAADTDRILGGRSFSCDINRPPPSGVSTPEGSRSRKGTAFYTDEGSAAVSKSTTGRGALAPESRLNAGRPVNASASNNRFRVYGNLPYYITSPILTHLFRFAGHIDSVHIVTQLEVAQRIVAHPRTRDYGYLSTFCQFYARPELVFRIPPGAFQPPPKVTSALIAMSFPGERANLGIQDDAAFLKFLQTCFAQKRKTLRNNLRDAYAHDAVAKALVAAALTEKSRAEELTLHQFARTFTLLSAQ
ncbi:MAG: ribosomal RNA small subunit methyltransferase A [Candidatus Acidiferrales bacterium]